MHTVDTNFFHDLSSQFSEIFIATIGGMIAYFIKYTKEKELDKNYKFSFVLFFINMLMGGFVGYLIGTLIPSTSEYKDFIIGMSGVASYPLLLILEGKFIELISKFVLVKFGMHPDESFASSVGECTPIKPEQPVHESTPEQPVHEDGPKKSFKSKHDKEVRQFKPKTASICTYQKDCDHCIFISDTNKSCKYKNNCTDFEFNKDKEKEE